MKGWGDGNIQPVTCRELVVNYARVLSALGLETELIRRWLWWFGSSERAVFIRQFEVSSEANVCAICDSLAIHAEAQAVVHSPMFVPDAKGLQASWSRADTFLETV